MIHGIINIQKEAGFTSHDVVAKLRGILHQKKIGHTGTLDPDATGVLPVCLGKGTKVCDMLTDRDKVYETVLLLGKETDTQDISGQVQRVCDTSGVTVQQVKTVIKSFEGSIWQMPPMYSAIKVNGKKLYELAREGTEVERKKRQVTIYGLRILKMELPRVWMEVSCSKGTYIRTLCHDIGSKLQTGGCMESLKRTRVGEFSLEESLTLEKVEALAKEGRLDSCLIPVDRLFLKYPEKTAQKGMEKALRNGNPIPIGCVTPKEGSKEEPVIRLYEASGVFMGIYEKKEKWYKPIKLFFDTQDPGSV